MKVSFSGSKKAHRPVVDDGLDVHYADAKRSGYRYRWYMLVTLVSAPIIFLLWIIIKPNIFILAPGIITTGPLQIRSANTAIVSKVLVKGDSSILAGSTLFILKNAEIDAQIKELKNQLIALEKQQFSQNEATLTALKSRIVVAQIGVNQQNELLASYNKFKDRGVVPTADMATVLQTNMSAKMALKQAEIDLLKERSLHQQDKVAGVVALQRNRLQLQLAQLTASQQALITKAPFSGTIKDIMVQAGERVAKDQPLLWLSKRKQPTVLTYVNEKYLNYVQIGQYAKITLPSGEVIRAEISERTQLVSKIPNSISGPFDGQKSALKVTLSLTEELPFLVENLPVEVRFYYFPQLWD
ncbi:MAG: HlyD family efflux transporter periplasmic adaptor subunit [Psychromonas sp.]